VVELVLVENNMNYEKRRTLEVEVENFLLERIKKDMHDLESIKVYALCKQAYEMENIRGILWDIKNLFVKGE